MMVMMMMICLSCALSTMVAALEMPKMKFSPYQSDEAKECEWKTKMHLVTLTATMKRIYGDVESSVADLLVVAF